MNGELQFIGGYWDRLARIGIESPKKHWPLCRMHTLIREPKILEAIEPHILKECSTGQHHALIGKGGRAPFQYIYTPQFNLSLTLYIYILYTHTAYPLLNLIHSTLRCIRYILSINFSFTHLLFFIIRIYQIFQQYRTGA